MANIETYNATVSHISQREGFCGGEPCITGRRIKVRHIYVWYELMGMSPDEIANQYNLSLGQVHGALTFAYDNLEAIQESIQKEVEFVEALKRENLSVDQDN